MRWLLWVWLLGSCARQPLTPEKARYQAAKARNARYYTPNAFKH